MDTETEGGGQTQTVDQQSDQTAKLPSIDPQRGSNYPDNPNGSFAKTSNHNSANNSDSGIEAEAPDVIDPRSKRNETKHDTTGPKATQKHENDFQSVLPVIANPRSRLRNRNDQQVAGTNQDPNSRDLGNSGLTTHSNPLHANNGYIYQEKLNFRKMAKSRVRSLDNLAYCTPQPSNYKIFNEKVDFRALARSKLDTYSSLDYKHKRPQVVIFHEKVDFTSNAKARIGSLENLSFQPRSNPNLRIFNEPLHVEAKPKIKSFENINFSPRKIESSVVQHSRDWFTPAKSTSIRIENSYFPSINNTNPIQLETAYKRRFTPRYSENEQPGIDDSSVSNSILSISKTPRHHNKQSLSYQSEPVLNNQKKVHFINNDELSIAHRKKFSQPAAEDNHFQAIDEESGQMSAQVTPRNIETRQSKSRLRGRRQSKVFPDGPLSSRSESRQFGNVSRLGTRDALPEIGEQMGQNNGNDTPDENHGVLQAFVVEQIYDAIVEKSAAPVQLSPRKDRDNDNAVKGRVEPIVEPEIKQPQEKSFEISNSNQISGNNSASHVNEQNPKTVLNNNNPRESTLEASKSESLHEQCPENLVDDSEEERNSLEKTSNVEKNDSTMKQEATVIASGEEEFKTQDAKSEESDHLTGENGESHLENPTLSVDSAKELQEKRSRSHEEKDPGPNLGKCNDDVQSEQTGGKEEKKGLENNSDTLNESFEVGDNASSHSGSGQNDDAIETNQSQREISEETPREVTPSTREDDGYQNKPFSE